MPQRDSLQHNCSSINRSKLIARVHTSSAKGRCSSKREREIGRQKMEPTQIGRGKCCHHSSQAESKFSTKYGSVPYTIVEMRIEMSKLLAQYSLLLKNVGNQNFAAEVDESAEEMLVVSQVKFRSLAGDIPLENTERSSDNMARTFKMFGTPQAFIKEREWCWTFTCTISCIQSNLPYPESLLTGTSFYRAAIKMILYY